MATADSGAGDAAQSSGDPAARSGEHAVIPDDESEVGRLGLTPSGRAQGLSAPTAAITPAERSDHVPQQASSMTGGGLLVSEQLLVMKREIDLLQLELGKSSVPWHRQVPVVVPVVVSVLALLFSLLTTYLAERRADSQEVQESRAELRQLIGQLHEIDREASAVRRQFADDPDALSAAMGNATTGKLIVANQAAEVIERTDEYVTATEYFAVGFALESVGGDDERVLEYYERGLGRARDANTKIALTRSLAAVHFTSGDYERGREAYEAALEASSLRPATKPRNDMETLTSWGVSELAAGHCDDARQRLEQAKEVAGVARDNAIPQRYQADLEDLEASVRRACG